MTKNLNKFNLVALYFLIAFISYGCGKENKSIVPDKVSLSEGYVSSIQQKTSLIKTIQKDTTFIPFDGMEERHVSYINAGDKPMSVHFLTVDIENPKLSLEVATPFDEPEFKLQRVRDMVEHKNVSNPPRQVVAALNGDYWDVNTPNIPAGTPLGLVYKNGQMIKDLPVRDYYFMGILNNGTAIIGDELRYRSVKSTIKEALGGRYFLLNNKQDISGSLNKNVEPRTAVGLLSDKRIVFIVVDGRRAGHSEGISMQDLAKMFSAIGANYAINFDGGGSSTYLLRNKEGLLETRNKPSGNSERAVANAWTIIQRN